MNNNTETSVHWSFWAISAFALIWNVLGSANYLSQMNADIVASLPETHRAIIEGRPVWATGGFAIAVFGGALGGLLLLLKKSTAVTLFIVSSIGTIVTMVHTVNVVRSPVAFSFADSFVMIALPLVVVAFLIWYSKRAQDRGWIS